MGVSSAGVFEWMRRRPWVVVLGLLMAASAGLLMHFRARLGFFLDDWSLVAGRAEGKPSDFLDPHNEHIIVLPTAIYKASLSLFGMDAMPLHLLAVAVFLVSVALLFLWIGSDLGDFLAVTGCAVILFLGVAWEDLLWAFQIGFFGSMAAGVGALLLLRRGDRLGCLLLTVSILFSSVGIPLVAAAFVSLLTDSRRTGFRPALRRVWIVAIPTAVFLLWWLGWGHEANNNASFQNLLDTPEYVVESLGLAIADITGLYKFQATFAHRDFLIGLVTLLGLAVLLWKRKRIPAPFVVAATAALVFWGLAGLNMIPARSYSASRYQYPGAFLTLMMLSGACSGLRPRPELKAALAIVAAFAIVVNVNNLKGGYWDVFKPLYEKGIAGVTALEIARETVDPGVQIGMNEDESALLSAGSWFDAVDRYGDGASWRIEEIPEKPLAARDRVDEVLIQALPIQGTQLVGERASNPNWSSCSIRTAQPGGSRPMVLKEGPVLVRPTTDVVISMGRFGDGAEQVAALGAAGIPTRVSIPSDRANRNWRISFTGPTGAVKVCTTS